MMVGGPPDHKYQWLRKHCLEPLSSWLLLASLHLVHGYHQLLFCTEALQLWKQLSSNGAGPELGTLGTQLISISQGRENSLQPISGQGPQRIFPFLSSLSGCHPIYFSVLLPYTPFLIYLPTLLLSIFLHLKLDIKRCLSICPMF